MEKNRSQKIAKTFHTIEKLGDKYNPHLRYFLVGLEYFWNLLLYWHVKHADKALAAYF